MKISNNMQGGAWGSEQQVIGQVTKEKQERFLYFVIGKCLKALHWWNTNVNN